MKYLISIFISQLIIIAAATNINPDASFIEKLFVYFLFAAIMPICIFLDHHSMKDKYHPLTSPKSEKEGFERP